MLDAAVRLAGRRRRLGHTRHDTGAGDMCIDACIDARIDVRTDMRSARAAHRWKALAKAVILGTGTSVHRHAVGGAEMAARHAIGLV